MSLPSQPFSERFGVRPASPQRRPDDVPMSARVRMHHLVDQERQKLLPGAWSLGPRLARALGRVSGGPGSIQEIGDLIQSVEWWEFYDLCEELLRCTGQPQEVAAKIDAVFASEGLPYRMTGSGIEWRMTVPAEQAIQETRRLLVQDEHFQGPAGQWEKALGHLAHRPPDAENCIKDAVGALEGVARIISQRESETLGQILGPLSQQLGIHGSLRAAISNLYGYRGDEDAIAHGATGPLGNPIAEAELVLHWCASGIAYLTKKWKQSQEGTIA